jgi:hypothetical protein
MTQAKHNTTPIPGYPRGRGWCVRLAAGVAALLLLSCAKAEPDVSTLAATGRNVRYSEWTSCGGFDESNPSSAQAGECLCGGVNRCEAVWGLGWFKFGSERFRVCGRADGNCVVVMYVEQEGAGVAKRCTLPPGSTPCSDAPLRAQHLIEHCEELFSCNLLQENCPVDLIPCK